MENLLKKWQLHSEEQQENFRMKCERKQSNWEESKDYTLTPLTFKELDEDLDQGFIKVQSNLRIQVLKEKNKKPVYMENLQNTNTDLVTVSTFGLSQKKKKLKNKHATKTQSSKLKFLSIANVKGDWFEVKNFQLPQNLNITEKDYEIEVLKEVNDSLINIKSNIFNIKPKKPFKIPKDRSSLTLPMNIHEDEFLMNIYQNLEINDDEVAFFMPDYIFNNFTSIYFKNFPWNLNIIKNKNKFIFSADISSENPFLFLQTYNENNMNKISEIEMDVATNNMESTLMEQTFYQLLTDQKETSQLKHNYRYIKIKLPDGLYIYTKLNLDAKTSKDKLVLLRTFNNISKWKNFNKNHIQIVNECLRNNIGRVTQWMAQAILTGSQEIYIGMIQRSNINKDDSHQILKVEKKKLEHLQKFFNFKQGSIFNGFKFMLNNIRNLDNDGSYILHKEFFKNQFVIYRLPKST